MSPLYEMLLFTAFVLGIYLGCALLIINRYNRLLNRLLGIVTLSISIIFLVFYLVNKKWIVNVPFFARSFTPLSYLIPACSFLYIRCFIKDEYRLQKKDIIHFLPFTFNVVLLLPYLFSSTETKRAYAKALVANLDYFQYYNTGFIPERYHVIARSLLLVVYLFLMWRLMLSNTYRSFVSKNKTRYPHSIYWIRFFAIFITVLGILAVLIRWQIILYGSTFFILHGSPLSMGLAIFFIILLAYGTSNPVILYGLPHFVKAAPEPATAPIIPIEHNIITPEPETPAADAVLPRAPFEKARMEAFEQVIRQYMEEQMPYCDPEFNLESMSKALNIPRHHLSWIFRFQIQQSFVDYRTHFRVEYVKRCMQEGLSKELTLEAIGEQAGFSSRSTFFVAFKKLTGQTPSAYLDSITAQKTG